MCKRTFRCFYFFNKVSDAIVQIGRKVLQDSIYYTNTFYIEYYWRIRFTAPHSNLRNPCRFGKCVISATLRHYLLWYSVVQYVSSGYSRVDCRFVLNPTLPGLRHNPSLIFGIQFLRFLFLLIKPPTLLGNGTTCTFCFLNNLLCSFLLRQRRSSKTQHVTC